MAIRPTDLENREGDGPVTEQALEHGERTPAPGPGERPDAFDVDPPEDTENPEDEES
jgi:hypothetical protein